MGKTDGQSSGNVVEMRKWTPNETAAQVSDFVRDHPLLVIVGGVALGAVAATLLPRGTGRKLARGAIGLAEAAGATGALLGSRMRETAETAGAELREQRDAMAERLDRLGETASASVEKLIEPVESTAAKVVRKAAELRSRVRH